MANTKISALTSGNPAQSSDEIPIARSGANYKITAGSIAALGGDVDGPASAVDNQIALFDSTTGKLIKAATTTGLLKASSGVIAQAVSGTDYAPATSGTAILYGNNAGGFSNVTVGSGLSFSAGTLSASGGAGTVTSVDVSGGTTGLTTSGGPVTSSGTITLAGTLTESNGGTGETTYTNGQLLIGNASGGLTKATLTAGSNVTITNGDGAITIAASSGGGGLTWQAVQTGNFTAVSGNAYPVNTTSAAITVTLPASPSAGDSITLTDYAGTFATNNMVVAGNGKKINSSLVPATFATNQ